MVRQNPAGNLQSAVARARHNLFIVGMSIPVNETDNGEILVCRVTRWYYRRMSLAAGMCLLLGAYFLYDWKIGYPKKNAWADKQEWFEKELLPSYDEAKAAGKLDEWLAKARAEGWPTGKDGEPPKWLQYSSMHGIPEKPKRYTQKEVDEQLWWGLGTGGIGLALLVVMLANRNKTLRGGSDHFVTPAGETVRFADVFRVDKRQWDNKGLAQVWHRQNGDGRTRKAVIDDLKFGGADNILERLLGAFKGELVEKVAEAADDGDGAPAGGPEK